MFNQKDMRTVQTGGHLIVRPPTYIGTTTHQGQQKVNTSQNQLVYVQNPISNHSIATSHQIQPHFANVSGLNQQHGNVRVVPQNIINQKETIVRSVTSANDVVSRQSAQ